MSRTDAFLLGLGACGLLTALMLPTAVVLTRYAARRHDAKVAAGRA